MLVTTSRNPSRKTRRFARVLSHIFGWIYVTRGKMSIEDLFWMAEKRNTSMGIVSEIKGNPAFIHFFNHDGRFISGLKISPGIIGKTGKKLDGYVLFSDEISHFPMKLFENAVVEKNVPEKFLRKTSPFIRVDVIDGGRKLVFYHGDSVILSFRIHEVLREGRDLV